MTLLLALACINELPVDRTGGCVVYRDSDGDGFGDGEDSERQQCDQVQAGWSLEDGDCDDDDPLAYPGAQVDCTGGDLNCDGLADDADGDGDGFLGCEECDDTLAQVHPGADELCNDRDDDCDGELDEDAVDPATWYGDGDGDGYGSVGDTSQACDQPDGYVGNDLDCDDGKSGVHPGAAEICDELDQDCDGAVDEDAVDATVWYADQDDDGAGDGTRTLAACELPTGYVANPDDCDDADGDAFPGNTETCDGVDQDCDGVVDDDAAGAPQWYADDDGDGFGDPDDSQTACDQPWGYIARADDCDDADSGIHPGVTETCDGVDEDCDGSADEGFDDTDADGTADCVDDCPVYADPTVSSGDGSSTSPYASIAEAISLRGGFCDEILLNPGTYYETVDYGGEDLDIRSVSGASSTILDGSTEGGPVVSFVSGESSAAVLEGVTITGGTGSSESKPGTSTTSTYGGGLYVYDADPTITDCVLEDNSAGHGGGAYLRKYSGTFDGNTVQDNTASATWAGAGLYVYDSDGTISGNTFDGNEATSSGGLGGALYAYEYDGAFTANVVRDNVASYAGGGLVLRECEAVVSNNLIEGNAMDGLVSVDGDETRFLNNTVDGNGYGMYLYNASGGSDPEPDLVNTILSNSAVYGIDVSAGSFGSIKNNDVWGSGEDDYAGLSDPTGTDSNISVDPDYSSSSDWSLQSTSACVDAGRTESGVTEDIDGTARPTGSAYDIGAYER
jgi:parallel beta-helix repeat protein